MSAPLVNSSAAVYSIGYDALDYVAYGFDYPDDDAILNQTAVKQRFYDTFDTALASSITVSYTEDYALQVAIFEGIRNITKYYSPFGLNNSQWFNSKYLNPYFYYTYNVTSTGAVSLAFGSLRVLMEANVTL